MNFARYLWLPCLMVAPSAFSQSLPVSVGVKGLYSIHGASTAEQDALGVEGVLGVEYQDFHAEVGVSQIGIGQSESITPVTFQVKRPFEVAPDTQLYLGVGGGWLSGGVRPTMSVGLRYQVTPSWVVDAGYQALLNAPNSGLDWVSFGLGVVYRTPPTPVVWEESEETVGYLLSVPEPVVDAPNLSVQCEIELQTYQVVDGDYLIKIAEQYEVTLSELLKWNEAKFINRDVNLIYPGESVVYEITVCH